MMTVHALLARQSESAEDEIRAAFRESLPLHGILADVIRRESGHYSGTTGTGGKMSEFSVIGKPIAMVDAAGKTTGSASTPMT